MGITKCGLDIGSIGSVASRPGEMRDGFLMSVQCQTGPPETKKDVRIVRLLAQTCTQELGTLVEPSAHEFCYGEPVACLIVSGLLSQEGTISLESFIQPSVPRKCGGTLKKLFVCRHEKTIDANACDPSRAV